VSRENAEAMRRALDAWNRGDGDAWLERVHPDVEWSSAIAREVEGRDKTYRGRAGMLEFWDEWRSVWDLTIEVAEVRDLGDTVIALGRIRTHGKGSGVDLDSPAAYVGEFDADGLLIRIRAYLDQDEALAAVGLRE
jgi:ketosteroid isomerase-like protein